MQRSLLVRSLFLAALAVPLAACVVVTDNVGGHGPGGTSYRGSGVSSTEARTVGSFRQVEVQGSTDVAIVVGGQGTSVTVTADDNLLERIATEVRGETLHVTFKEGSYSYRVVPIVRVALPALAAVTLLGSSDATVEGLHGGSFRVVVKGSGDVRARGHVDTLEALVQGSGDLALSELEARAATVRIDGSGDADVRATESLVAELSGSGDIVYRGDPGAVTSTIHGSGSVRKR